jgi:hypothetical protein
VCVCFAAVQGLISAKGGHGGRTNTADSFGGGGGAGGRVAMYAQSISVLPTGNVFVDGEGMATQYEYMN